MQWLLNTEQQPHQLEEAILGLVASMDKPGSPAGEAITACYALLHARTPTFRRTLRERLLHVTLEDLKRVARQYLIEQTPVKLSLHLLQNVMNCNNWALRSNKLIKIKLEMNMAFRQFERTSLQLSMGTLLSCLCASVAYADTLAL